jgi:hypothetical protein
MAGRKAALAGYLCSRSGVHDQTTQRCLLRGLYTAFNQPMAFLLFLGIVSIPQ